jgi:hypothetical protein
MRKVFGSKAKTRTGSRIKLLNEVLHDFRSSQNINRIIEFGGTRWAGCMRHMGEERNTYRVLVVNMQEDVVDRVTSKLTLNKYDDRVWIRLIWLRIGARSELLWTL